MQNHKKARPIKKECQLSISNTLAAVLCRMKMFYPIVWVDQRLLAECIQLNMCVELIGGV